MARRRLKTKVCSTCSLVFTGDSCSRCERPRTCGAADEQPWLQSFIAARTCKGAQCSNCGVVFTVDQGDGKRLLIFPNGGGGTAFYVVCRECGQLYQRGGPTALPNVWRDCKLTVLMSPHNPANAAAFRVVH
jgi:hypothetical protein